jgi:hypothetical protein
MKCLCIGICQLDAIYKILKVNTIFTSIYTEIINYTIFTVTEEEMENILNNIVPTCDLILSQPVSENYRGNNIFSTSMLRSKIKSGAKHLVIPNCYFTGYDPIPFQTTDESGNIIHIDNISYYPSICIQSLLNNDCINCCIDWCNLDVYNSTELNNNYNKTINELKIREEKVFDNNFGTDIKISDYIEQNYKDVFLFHTYNHPTNVLLFELVRRLFRILGLLEIEIGFKITNELLGINSIPPCPSVYTKMDMKFTYPKFIINSNVLTTKGAMDKFINSLKLSDVKLHNKWIAGIKYGRTKLQ